MAMWQAATALGYVAAAPTSTVYVMRHCARATYYPDLEYVDRFTYLSNYSDGGPLPPWGVPEAHCTARGRKIVVGQGRHMKAELDARAGLAGALKVVYDGAAARDKTTAEDFLSGAGRPACASEPRRWKE